MRRIRSQHPEDEKLAFQILAWISHARRPLKLRELQSAILVRPGDKVLEKEIPIPEAEIISACAGLVTVDPQSQTIRLVHFTVEEYFKTEKGRGWFPDAEKLLAETCLTYLSFDIFAEGPCEYHLLYCRLTEYPLLEYAAHHWGFHAHVVFKEVEKFWGNFQCVKGKVASALQVANHYEWWAKDWKTLFAPSLFLMATFGFHEFAARWLHDGVDVNAYGPLQQTPLFIAARRGHLDMLSLFIDRGADLEAVNSEGLTPLLA
jgi:Ankyrin repeats (many copies)